MRDFRMARGRERSRVGELCVVWKGAKFRVGGWRETVREQVGEQLEQVDEKVEEEGCFAPSTS